MLDCPKASGKMSSLLLLMFLIFQVITVTLSEDEELFTAEHEKQNIPVTKFKYARKEPGNELGVFTKVIAHIHRKANQTTDEWRLNKEYLPDDVYESLKLRCEEKETEESPIAWKGCVSDDEGFFAYVTWGVPEPKNKTITYLELEFRPFKKKNESGAEQICILEEVYKNKAFIVLKTYNELSPAENVFEGLNKLTSERIVTEHQLDSFGENFLGIFEDKIDVNAIYNFGDDESFDRDPPYECFLSIGSSEVASILAEKCDFFCPHSTGLSQEELETVLLQAKKEAEKAEGETPDKESSESNHDEL
ncbi:unnamed protein product [Orchesella dallaii]|uniref:Uncharacterized protein n=1 Tax=Orchesella dallaii TaxID=48710 RepID=A0ABP1QE82_9HEXA